MCYSRYVSIILWPSMWFHFLQTILHVKPGQMRLDSGRQDLLE